jgi:hypothetical protein
LFGKYIYASLNLSGEVGTAEVCREESCSSGAPTRHFVLLRRVWFLVIKFFGFEAYSLLAPKCRVGALWIYRLLCRYLRT